MITLTMQTILYGAVVAYLISLIVLYQVWYHNRKKYVGLSLWVLAWAFLFLGFGLLCLRGLIPDWISIVVANSSVVGGTLLIYFGLRLFTEKKNSRLLIGLATAFFAIFTCVHVYFTFVYNDLLTRSYNVNIALVIIYFTSSYLLFFRAGPKTRRLSTGTAVAFLILILVQLARILGFALGSITTNDFLKTGAYDTAMLGLAIGANLYLTFSLVLMVHRRLQLETEDLYEKVTRSEANTKHLNSLLSTVRGVNQLISREKDRERLIEKICNLISETRGFFCTWILLFDEKRRYVSAAVVGSMETRVFSQQLEQGNYPPCVDIILAHKESLAVCGDIVENGLECLPKRSYSGGHALISRLEYEDKVYGTVGIYVQSDYMPDPEEQSLFRELAGDIAFALYNIDREEILKQSEERFRIVFEYAPDAYYLNDLEGNFIDGNIAAERLSGYAKEELIGKSFLNLNMLRPQDVQRAAELLIKNVNGQSTGPNEFPLTRKDGSQVMIEISTFPVKIRGQPLVLAIARDITERKQAEESLRQSKERYRALFDSSVIGTLVLDAETMKVVMANQAVAEIFGFSSTEEVIQVDNPFDFVLSEDRERVLEIVTKSLFERGLQETHDIRAMTKDGRNIWITATAARIMHEGRPAGLISFTDITVRKQVEEALRQSEEKHRTMLEEMEDSYFEVDLGGHFTFVNNAVCRHLGYTREELIGMSYKGFTTEEDIESVFRVFNEVYRTDEPNKSFNWQIIRKDGVQGFVEALVSPLRNDKGEIIGFRGVGCDISERRQMEEQLIVADRLASIGELASGIAHELNNPLTGIIGFSQLLAERNVPEEIKEDLKLINSEAQRAANVVKGLLTFARKHPPVRQLSNINDVIGKVLELRAYEQKVSNIETVINLAPDLPKIGADFFQLQQVFLNIVTNAEYFMLKAHNKGTLTITTGRLEDIVRISFTDDGPGISGKDLGHVFDPFFTTKEVGQGTGLGLSISHGIVTAHGGRIYAESKQGKGATFVVELPIGQEEGSYEKSH